MSAEVQLQEQMEAEGSAGLAQAGDGDKDSDTESHQEPRSLRHRIHAFLERKSTHMVVIGLILLDAIVILAGLILEYEKCSRESEIITREVDAAGVVIKEEVEKEDEETVHKLEKALHALHYTSLAIVSIFMIELGLKLYAHRWHLLRQPYEVFDGIVIVVSFFLDIFLPAETGLEVSLIIVLRLWRIARVLNSVVVSIEIQHHTRIHKMRRELKQLQHRAIQSQTLLQELKAYMHDSPAKHRITSHMSSMHRTLNSVERRLRKHDKEMREKQAQRGKLLTVTGAEIDLDSVDTFSPAVSRQNSMRELAPFEQSNGTSRQTSGTALLPIVDEEGPSVSSNV